MAKKRQKVDALISQLSEVKLSAMHYLPKRAATFHAIDVALQIAGWELAAELQNQTIFPKKVRDIYLGAAGEKFTS